MKPHRTRLFSFSWRFLLVAGLLAASAIAQEEKPQETRRSETLAPGIEHLEIRRGDFTTEAERERWIIHALILDPQRARLTLARALDEIVGAETTSSLAARHSALAAINGGYFRTTGTYRGEPNGLLAMNGKLLSEPVGHRAGLAVANIGGQTRAIIARFDFKAEIKVAGRYQHVISGFNRPREENELIVFTPEFHRTTLTKPDGIEVVVSKGRVMAVRDRVGSQPIPTRGYVISASGAARQWARTHLRRGTHVVIRSQVVADPPLPFAADFIIGAGPQLVKDNQFVRATDEKHSDDLIRQRHPRTAIGIRRDGRLVLVTVDGRQPKKSVGMTIKELAALMIELECRDALNLDGGGSTAMVIKNRVVNNPSDQAGERPVSDALLVYQRRER